MSFELLIMVGVVVLAAIPCLLFLTNLAAYRRLPGGEPRDRSQNDRAGIGEEAPGLPISVLIPARNEEENICATLASILTNDGVDFDVTVLDDHSDDRTASLVGEIAARDSRVKVRRAPRLPEGWCGKQHACHMLAGTARHPLLLFIDADVRLAPGALRRLSQFMSRSGADLASGVPRQQMGTFSERLLLPMIHFLLLGFLPMRWMRRSKAPRFSAGCGQLFIARAEAYRSCHGHAAIRDSLHDGLRLPRVFREAGFTTDLFDATDVATCRMYQSNRAVWAGLGKNATEGMGAPNIIVPMTALLLGGQVLPLVLWGGVLGGWQGFSLPLMTGSVLLICLPRFLAAWRFNQPMLSALLHPLSVVAFLGIQWLALLRCYAGRPAVWKGRAYGAAPSRAGLGSAVAGVTKLGS